MISRRDLIAGIFAAVSAPAIVKANNLMKLNGSKIILPPYGYILMAGQTLPLSMYPDLELSFKTPGRWQSINESTTQNEFVKLANLAEMHRIATQMSNILGRVI